MCDEHCDCATNFVLETWGSNVYSFSVKQAIFYGISTNK